MNGEVKEYQSRPLFMTITAASTYFGVSKYFLRCGIRNGSIAHTFIGNRYMIDVSAFQRQMDNGVYLRTMQNRT